MKKKKSWIYRDKEYRSREEIEFAIWLVEAINAKIVVKADYEPKTFLLSESQWRGTKFLLSKQVYTPDWYVEFTENINSFDHGLVLNDLKGWFDIKGTYSRGFINSTAYTFPVIQKWLYQKEGVFVNKLISRDLMASGKITRRGFFTRTWVPEECAFKTEKGERIRNKAFEHCKLLNQTTNGGLFGQ